MKSPGPEAQETIKPEMPWNAGEDIREPERADEPRKDCVMIDMKSIKQEEPEVHEVEPGIRNEESDEKGEVAAARDGEDDKEFDINELIERIGDKEKTSLEDIIEIAKDLDVEPVRNEMGRVSRKRTVDKIINALREKS